MKRITTYFSESYKELIQKVSWPNWAQLQQSTVIVLVSTVIITLVVLGMDFITNLAVKNGIYTFFKATK
jgi:preprotein translocase subunit SecE